MASRLHKPLQQWTAEDVHALIEERVEEGPRLEYKRELTLDSRGQRLEAAKDVTGLANANGGVLVFGVEEEELSDGRRLPTKAYPLVRGNLQAQLEDVLHSAVSPPLNMSAVTLENDGGYFIVVRVQPRNGPLHMVEGYGQHRYFIRTGLSTRPMEAHEVERAFRELQASESRAISLLLTLPLLPRLDPRRSRTDDLVKAPEDLREMPWSSVVAVPLDVGRELFPMRTPTSQDFPITQPSGFRGDQEYIHSGSFTIDSLGYISEARHPQSNMLLHRLRLFREGVLEWGFRYTSSGGGRRLFSTTLLLNAHDALRYFGSVYERAAYFGRVQVVVRIDNADQSEFGIQESMILPGGNLGIPPRVDFLEYRADTNVEQLLLDPMPVVHAAMDRIWQGYGFSQCLLFRSDGQLKTAAELQQI